MFSLKYILIIAVISYIIYLLTEMKIEENNEKNKDGYKNYLEIDEELNKKIMVEYEQIQNDKK